MHSLTLPLKSLRNCSFSHPPATKCATPEFGSNVIPNFSTGNLHNSVASFSCEAGFKLTSTQNITCTAANDDSTWPISNAPDCVATQCVSKPGNPNHGIVSFSNGDKHNSVANFSCDPAAGTHVIFTGEHNVTCTAENADSTWPTPNPTPTCTLTCGYLPVPPANGTVNSTVSTDSSTGITNVDTTFSCNPGYKLIGNATGNCSTESVNTLWLDTINTSVTCPPTYCANAPIQPRDGFVNFDNGNRYASVASFSCKSGFQLNGTASVACAAESADADWPSPPVTPTCIYDGSNSNLDTQGRFAKFDNTVLNFVVIHERKCPISRHY